MQLAFYQPDIPQNLGSALRLAMCMATPLHFIEPCGFIFDDKRIRRSGMDYIDQAMLIRHSSWAAFLHWREAQSPRPRILLMTTKGSTPLTAFAFRAGDILLMGQESAGVPDAVAATADARLRIPMAAGARSLNVVVSCALALGEGLRQTDGFPQ